MNIFGLCVVAWFAGWGFMNFISKNTRFPLWVRIILLGLFSLFLGWFLA